MSRKTIVSAAALLLASAGAAAAFPATATSNLNVRSGPGTGYSVVDQLRPGETVEVTATSGSWYQIDGQGWASASYLDADRGGRSAVIIDRGYGYDYGPTAFYYGSDPYYWDDAGYYFYVRDGRRHRVGWDWFRSRDHRRDFRWSDNRRRGDFERRWGRMANDGDRRRVSDSDRRGSEGERRSGPRVERQADADAVRVRGEGEMRSGRASAEDERRMRVRGNDGPRQGGGRGGEGPRGPSRGDANTSQQPPIPQTVPGSGN